MISLLQSPLPSFKKLKTRRDTMEVLRTINDILQPITLILVIIVLIKLNKKK
ncbi:hypothetical protein HMPREF3221_01649 [Fusobacterium nucleatum]|uniref:Uncharacterized protein n=1 Tax=Fusobacterium nucleatum TaxID=851 RepID=A0A133NQT2_FUSNU|nr:hypothetical protein HMPREF3221_01649 [Fusobacterium nucleatum]